MAFNLGVTCVLVLSWEILVGSKISFSDPSLLTGFFLRKNQKRPRIVEINRVSIGRFINSKQM